MDLIKPKGTRDYFGLEAKKFFLLEKLLSEIALKYGFERITYPLFEQTTLFVRSTGEETDIVSKEMYSFQDKGGRDISLRPEGTASTVRMVLENKLVFRNERKQFFYFEPMFRYERPQSGRQRQFYQFGVEIFGDNSIEKEVELIQFAREILNFFKIDFKLIINSLGSSVSRNKYILELSKYLQNHFDNLSEDSKRRLSTNTLRVLDSKDLNDRKIIANAPKLNTFLSEEEIKKFNKFTSLLDDLNVNYEIDLNLVRGLDYYNDLVFEFVSTEDNLTLLGGGRYDNLINSFNSKLSVPAIGFAIGVERMMIKANLDNINDTELVYIASLDKDKRAIIDYSNKLRNNGLKVRTNFNSAKYQDFIKRATEEGFKYIYIIDENSKNIFKIDLFSEKKDKITIKE